MGFYFDWKYKAAFPVTSSLQGWYQRKQAKTESLNKIECHSIIPKVSPFQMKFSHHTKNQENLRLNENEIGFVFNY